MCRNAAAAARSDGPMFPIVSYAIASADHRTRGGPDRPFTREELHAKFTDCAQLTMSAERMAKALAAIEGVQEMKSIRELVSALV